MILINTHIKDGQLLDKPLNKLSVDFKDGDVYVETSITDMTELKRELESELKSIRGDKEKENDKLRGMIVDNNRIISTIEDALR